MNKFIASVGSMAWPMESLLCQWLLLLYRAWYPIYYILFANIAFFPFSLSIF